MTQSVVTIEGLTKLANDLLVQNTAIRNKLDKVETQRDELLEVLEKLFYAIDCGDEWRICNAQELASDAIAKAKEE